MPLILPGNVATATADTVYTVANSCMFDRDDEHYMVRTYGTATNTKKFTYSFWLKRTASHSNGMYVFENVGSYGGENPQGSIWFNGSDQFGIFEDTYGSGSGLYVQTNRKFRDFSAWYHFVVAVDSTQSTAANRVKIYVNGTQETSLANSTYPAQNHTLPVISGSGNPVQIGKYNNSNSNLSGYLAEVFFVDGSQLAASSFGEFNEDTPTVWQPKDCKDDLTFGNNGYYLDFEDSGDLGDDESGNGNDFTENNLAATDQATDTCTNNFATFNPLDQAETGTAIVFSQGNCKGVTAVDTTAALQSTIAVSSGKWYAEFKVTKVGDNLSGGRTTVGIGSRNNASVNGHYYGNTASPVDSYGKYSASAHYYSNNGSTTSYGSSFVDDDIIGVYLDLDNNKLYFSENGTLYSSTGISITAAASTLNGHYHIGAADASANDNGEYLANYGGCPAFTISSAVSDDNGYGSFEYSPNITGDGEAKKFYALCTKNLAEFGG